MDNTALKRLHEHLESLRPGVVERVELLLPVLEKAWPALQGGDECGMKPRKLSRAQKFEWQPPFLRFEIERHGAMAAGGSSRAERQMWDVNVEEATADAYVVGYVQTYKRSPVFKTDSVAEELAEFIVNGRADPRLRWSKAGKVQVRMEKILPAGPKQTTAGRQKRLNRDLEKRLVPLGWSRGRTGWWAPPDDSRRGTKGAQSGATDENPTA